MPQNPEGHQVGGHQVEGRLEENLSLNQNRNQSLQHHKAPQEEGHQGREEDHQTGRQVAEEESPMLLAGRTT